MKTTIFKTSSKKISILPFSDLHVGCYGFTERSEKTLQGNIDWVKNNKDAYAILCGDMINCATLNSPSSPFREKFGTDLQIAKVVDLFRPIKHKILGAIDGNHEERLIKYCDYSPTISICDRLGIKYMGTSGVYIIRLGMHKSNNREFGRASFTLYSHHTTGGGTLLGSKMNRVIKLREIIGNADCYIGGHNHMLGIIHDMIYTINPTVGSVEEVRQLFVDAGSYMEWNNSYAEQKQLSPSQIGSPKIMFEIKCTGRGRESSIKKDIHASI